ncbi:MAG: SMI1/KNR4 family protein [Pirellulales bacterium]
MPQELLIRARQFVERAATVGRHGRVAGDAEIEALAATWDRPLPDWYRTLLTDVPLIGLELGIPSWPAQPDFDGVEWLEWLSPEDSRCESVEVYPGIALRPHGYLCLAGQSAGGGDQYFVRFADGDDPPLLQIFHDVRPWTDEAGTIHPDASRVVRAFAQPVLRSSPASRMTLSRNGTAPRRAF